MYVNPFWLGVLVTVVVEIVGIFIYAMALTWKRGKK